MAPLILLDTHVVVWLYLGRADLLSGAARRLVEVEELAMSPVTALELEYLFEIERLTVPAQVVVHSLAREIDLRTAAAALGDVVEAARRIAWTRDPFDRLIVGHASHAAAPLVSRDEAIRDNYPLAVW